MTDTPIRRARPDDAAEIAAFTRDAYSKWVEVIGREPLPMQVDYVEALGRHRFDVLEVEGRLAALVETTPDGDYLLVENLAVRPSYQKRGYGEQLLRWTELLAQEGRHRGVRLYTNKLFDQNIRFYERRGYVVEREAPVNGGVVVYMSKQLAPLTRDDGPAMSAEVNLAQKLSTFSDLWSPRTVAKFNGCDVMVVKVKDEFVWHKHDDTDDFFLVLKGRLEIQLRDKTVVLEPGELYVVPRGVEHRPIAREETHLLLIEPSGTPNTGDAATAAPRVEI
jgi:mannose-6-phosphate isomerase-like protein (cupin superfamily)/ribosomal protein S18 acetylase RimI-like enzyme